MRTIQVYSLAELKERFPDAYARVHERWKNNLDDVPWTEETMESLQAVVDAAGGSLEDWSIGAYSRSYIRVRVADEDEDGRPKDARWFRLNVLKPNGYVKKNGHVAFPGHCRFTGYYADDAFLEHVYQRLLRGDSLTDALESLADVAQEMMEANLDQYAEEESMEANWGHLEFTEDGSEV